MQTMAKPCCTGTGSRITRLTASRALLNQQRCAGFTLCGWKYYNISSIAQGPLNVLLFDLTLLTAGE